MNEKFPPPIYRCKMCGKATPKLNEMWTESTCSQKCWKEAKKHVELRTGYESSEHNTKKQLSNRAFDKPREIRFFWTPTVLEVSIFETNATRFLYYKKEERKN